MPVLPRIANFDDLDPLAAEPAVELVPHREEAIDRTPGALAADPAWRDWKYDPAVFAPLAVARYRRTASD